MKKKFVLTFAALIVAGTSSLALANPTGVSVDVVCPVPQDPNSMLSNYGNFIAGYGLEHIEGHNPTRIYFKSDPSIKGVPAKLDQYQNYYAEYSSTTGNVTCSYISNDGTPSFKVIYTLINAKGGQVINSTSNEITIIIPFGANHHA